MKVLKILLVFLCAMELNQVQVSAGKGKPTDLFIRKIHEKSGNLKSHKQAVKSRTKRHLKHDLKVSPGLTALHYGIMNCLQNYLRSQQRMRQRKYHSVLPINHRPWNNQFQVQVRDRQRINGKPAIPHYSRLPPATTLRQNSGFKRYNELLNSLSEKNRKLENEVLERIDQGLKRKQITKSAPLITNKVVNSTPKKGDQKTGFAAGFRYGGAAGARTSILFLPSLNVPATKGYEVHEAVDESQPEIAYQVRNVTRKAPEVPKSRKEPVAKVMQKTDTSTAKWEDVTEQEMVTVSWELNKIKEGKKTKKAPEKRRPITEATTWESLKIDSLQQPSDVFVNVVNFTREGNGTRVEDEAVTVRNDRDERFQPERRIDELETETATPTLRNYVTASRNSKEVISSSMMPIEDREMEDGELHDLRRPEEDSTELISGKETGTSHKFLLTEAEIEHHTEAINAREESTHQGERFLLTEGIEHTELISAREESSQVDEKASLSAENHDGRYFLATEVSEHYTEAMSAREENNQLEEKARLSTEAHKGRYLQTTEEIEHNTEPISGREESIQFEENAQLSTESHNERYLQTTEGFEHYTEISAREELDKNSALPEVSAQEESSQPEENAQLRTEEFEHQTESIAREGNTQLEEEAQLNTGHERYLPTTEGFERYTELISAREELDENAALPEENSQLEEKTLLSTEGHNERFLPTTEGSEHYTDLSAREELDQNAALPEESAQEESSRLEESTTEISQVIESREEQMPSFTDLPVNEERLLQTTLKSIEDQTETEEPKSAREGETILELITENSKTAESSSEKMSITTIDQLKDINSLPVFHQLGEENNAREETMPAELTTLINEEILREGIDNLFSITEHQITGNDENPVTYSQEAEGRTEPVSPTFLQQSSMTDDDVLMETTADPSHALQEELKRDRKLYHQHNTQFVSYDPDLYMTITEDNLIDLNPFLESNSVSTTKKDLTMKNGNAHISHFDQDPSDLESMNQMMNQSTIDQRRSDIVITDNDYVDSYDLIGNLMQNYTIFDLNGDKNITDELMPEFNPETLIKLVPVIVHDLRNRSISPEEMQALSEIFGQLWPAIQTVAHHSNVSIMELLNITDADIQNLLPMAGMTPEDMNDKYEVFVDQDSFNERMLDYVDDQQESVLHDEAISNLMEEKNYLDGKSKEDSAYDIGHDAYDVDEDGFDQFSTDENNPSVFELLQTAKAHDAIKNVRLNPSRGRVHPHHRRKRQELH